MGSCLAQPFLLVRVVICNLHVAAADLFTYVGHKHIAATSMDGDLSAGDGSSSGFQRVFLPFLSGSDISSLFAFSQDGRRRRYQDLADRWMDEGVRVLNLMAGCSSE